MNFAEFTGAYLRFLVLGALACAGASADAASASPWRPAGEIDDAALTEISGLARSHRAANLFWVVNDSGHSPTLYAVDATGRKRAEVQVANAVNQDWEDLAAYSQDGVATLAIADCGDNFGWRDTATIYVLREPALDATRVEPSQVFKFRFEGGPRDCESLAADPAHRRFLLLDKGRQPAGLYELPWSAAPSGVARRIGELRHTDPEQPAKVSPAAGKWRGTPTAMDLDAGGLRLLVLTYRHALVYTRKPEEDWPAAVQRRPRAARLPRLRLAEAAAFDERGDVWVTSEGLPAPLLRWRP